jgi:hypothetical protein
LDLSPRSQFDFSRLRADRVERVRAIRLKSHDKGANEMALRAHQMREMNIAKEHAIAVPAITSG